MVKTAWAVNQILFYACCSTAKKVSTMGKWRKQITVELRWLELAGTAEKSSTDR